MALSDLPLVNACLNGLSTCFLIAGFICIRRKRTAAHRNCMLGAVTTSTLFLISYVYYHLHAGRTEFKDPAWFRPFYLGLLLTHTVLAVAIVPMVLVTLIKALRKRFDQHKRIARWTLPLWLYVSVTGVLIYLLLYQIFQQKPAGVTERVPGWPATNAQPRLATLKLLIGNQVITAELCRRRLEIMTGMMFRTNMAEDEGMLFTLHHPQQTSFYMKNTLVPLTAAYIDPEGRIVELHDLEPLNEKGVPSQSDRILYVLEMKQGWFARKGVAPGATIVTEKGPLTDTVKFIGPDLE